MRFLLIIVVAFSVATTWAGDTDKQNKEKEKKPVKVEQPYAKSKGKPADPGAHGRANAAAKQAANPGKASGKTGDPEVTPLTAAQLKELEKKKDKKKKDGNDPG